MKSKKQRLKRVISLVLVLLLIVSVLSSCAAGEQGIQGEKGADGKDGIDGKDGVSVQSVELDDQGRLVFILSDGTKLPPMEIQKSNEEKIIQCAKDALIQYLLNYEGNNADAEYMIYESDGRFVALHNGNVIGVYKSKEDALKAMLDDTNTVENESDAFETVQTTYGNLFKVISKAKEVDLVIFMGQSNMAGYGGNASKAPAVPEGRGYWFKSIADPTKLYPLTEPFGNGEKNTSSGLGTGQMKGSMVSAFVNEYYESTGVPVVAVSAAQGNTAIEWWQPGKAPLNDAINRYKTAKEWLGKNGYTIRHNFMVWCQGESDGWNGTSKETYKAKYGAILDAMKAEGIETCFMVRIGVQKNNATEFDAIIAAQTDLCREREDTVMACTATAGFVAEGLMSDNVHYSQDGYNLAGKLAGGYAADYVNTGIEPSMYDARYGNTYRPIPNTGESGYKLNTNIDKSGAYNDYGNGRITLTDYIPCTETPVVTIDCEEEYIAAVRTAGGDAVSALAAIRYYDENKTFIGTSSNGNHSYVRIILYVNGSNGKADLGLSSGTVVLPDDIAEDWMITLNGEKILLTNKDS